MKTKDRKLRIPKHAAAQHCGLLEPFLILCKDVVIRLQAIRKEGIDDYDLDCGNDNDNLAAIDEAIADWQDGADRVEAEMEFIIMCENGERGPAESHGWTSLPATPRLTTAYAKGMTAWAKRQKAKELALKGLAEAQEADHA